MELAPDGEGPDADQFALQIGFLEDPVQTCVVPTVPNPLWVCVTCASAVVSSAGRIVVGELGFFVFFFLSLLMLMFLSC